MPEQTQAIDGASGQRSFPWFWASLLVPLALSLLVGLVASLPAQLALQWSAAPVRPVAIGGTLWTGSALMDGGHALRWTTRGWDSVRSGALVADVVLEGPGTALRAEVRVGSGGVQAVVVGRAGWALIEAFRPDIEIACAGAVDLQARVSLGRDGARQGSGQGTSPPGTCARRDGSVIGVPLPGLVHDLATDAGGIVLRITQEDTGQTLADVRLTPDDRVQVLLTQAAVAQVPGLPAGGDLSLDLPLLLLTP